MSMIIEGLMRKNNEKPLFTKDSPYLAKLRSRSLLNHPDSTKKTFHLELDIKNSSISYDEGDAIAVIPSNPAWLVDKILSHLKTDGLFTIQDPRSSKEMTLREFLISKANLSKVTPALLKWISHPFAAEDAKVERTAFISTNDVLTTLSNIEATSLETLPSCFAPLLPRFYSIASSPKLHPDVVHLLVVTFHYNIQGEERVGVGSDFLCHQADLDATPIPIYVQQNPHFALPQNPDVPIIMIGPGTGVAPFRAFLQRRSLSNVKTKNWLFFGERRRSQDFYYEKEWDNYLNQGILKLSTAFSRDQDHKIYVQHLMRSEAKTLWEWIQDGAIIYICGDAHHMAKDVIDTLLFIFESEGRFPIEKAKELLLSLRKEKRLQQDVY